MIYLDYAATAPLRPQVRERLYELSAQPLGNASSLHRAGRRARMVLEEARERCAQALGAKVEEIVLCSGATEADNLAIGGVLSHGDSRWESLISSSLEHAAVYEFVRREEQKGRSVDWLRSDALGLLDTEELKSALQDGGRKMVSVTSVNNEVGTRQDLASISALCKEHGALLHVDAVQDPVGAKEAIEKGWADTLALSGHKLGGLPGGLLYVRQGVPLNPLILGGSQEDGRRAGTSEVLRTESFALALELALSDDREKYRRFTKLFADALEGQSGTQFLGPQSPDQRAGHISSWVFAGLSAEPILVQLDMKGICASSGSACSSHSVEPSRVLKAMGFGDEEAKGLVRFSWGWNTQEQEVQRAGEALGEILSRMREKEALKK